MRATKWIFIGYLLAVVLIIVGIAASFSATPPRDPKTLYLPLAASLRTLDPAEINDTIGAPIVGSMYECLYNYKYGQTQPYELMPELAADMPQVSDGGKTLTIKLRRGIHFYDPDHVVFPDGVGPEVKAADAIYSFKRIANFQLASANYSGTFEGEIVGLEDWWSYTQKAATPDRIDWNRPVEGFEALDDYTIRLKLTKPDPQMTMKLAHEPTGVVCRQVVEHYGDNFRWHPVGTGPFCMRYADHLPSQRMIMLANPIYRGKPDMDGVTPLPPGQKMPRIQRVQYEYFAEDLPVWILFKQGLFDVGGIPKDTFSQAISVDSGDLTADMRRRGISLVKYAEPVTEYIGFNMKDPIVGKNKPLRQAMSLAFDRETYIKNFLNGRGQPCIGPIPPGFPTFDPHATNPYTQFNLARAREKMQEAVKINGGPIPPLQILMRDADTTSRQMAEYFRSQMLQIGVDLQPEFRDFARWQEMVDNRQTQIFDAGWEADYPDEQTFLQLFYGPNGDAGGLNSSVYNDPEFNSLYEKASVMPDSSERRKLYLRMEQIVMDDCPWLLETYFVRYQLLYDWVQGYHPMNYGYGFRQYLSLDEGLRVKRQMGKR